MPLPEKYVNRRSAVDPAMLAELVKDPAKRDTYLYDPYMREGLLSFGRLFGFGSVHNLTFVVLKPDAIVGRRSTRALDVLGEDGWQPVAATALQFDPLLTREVWRYQFNAASEERIAIVDHLLGSGRSLLVLLEDLRRPAWLPASVRLTGAKGTADPNVSRRGDLRTRIGRVNELFNFIHTADDPADLIRELQLFSYQTAWDWCADVLAGHRATDKASVSERVRHALHELEDDTVAHDLDFGNSVDRLAGREDAWGRCARRSTTRDRVGDWLDLLSTDPLPVGSARWDALTVLTSWIDCNQPGIQPLLATGRATDWVEGGL